MSLTPAEKHEIGNLAMSAAYVLDPWRDLGLQGSPTSDTLSEAFYLAAGLMAFAQRHAADEPVVAHLLKQRQTEKPNRLKPQP